MLLREPPLNRWPLFLSTPIGQDRPSPTAGSSLQCGGEPCGVRGLFSDLFGGLRLDCSSLSLVCLLGLVLRRLSSGIGSSSRISSSSPSSSTGFCGDLDHDFFLFLLLLLFSFFSFDFSSPSRFFFSLCFSVLCGCPGDEGGRAFGVEKSACPSVAGSALSPALGGTKPP